MSERTVLSAKEAVYDLLTILEGVFDDLRDEWAPQFRGDIPLTQRAAYWEAVRNDVRNLREYL